MTYIKLRHTYGSGHLHGMSAPGLDLEIALEPDALHRETQRRLTTGEQRQPLIIEHGYTATGQIEQLTLQSPNSANAQAYQYDALGRMLFRSQHAQGQGAQGQTRPTIAYNYDAAGRLIGSQHGHDAHRYPVDAAGNRSAAPNATNQLAQLNGTRYRYDGAGNLVHREHQNGERLTLGYDGANRLVTLTRTTQRGTTTHAHYRYDALGRRIDKTVHHPDGSTATTHYGWDGDRIVREDTSNQRTTVVYEPGSFVPLLRIDETQDPQGNQTTQLSAYITDALGTPLQLLSPNGKPRWLAEPDDWAAVNHQRAVPNLTQPIRFQGQWHDDESGLYYNRHRYYDPEQGRYISQDPIGLNGGTNLYGYVTNPIGMVDPLGLFGTGFNSVEAAYGHAAREAHGRVINGQSPIPDRAGALSMCSALSNLGDNEVMVSVAGGKGLAAELALKASSKGISTIAGIGAGGGAAVVGSVGRSVNYGAPENQRGTDWRGFTSISGGNPQLFGGDVSFATGTDGITGGARGGYGFGAAVVSGVQAESYVLKCD